MIRKQRPFPGRSADAVGLIAAPFVLPYLGFAPTTINRILVWGLFGIGFDILFGFTGLLSFGQSAFFGTGGMVAAYLLTEAGFPYVMVALLIGMIVAAVVGYLVGLIALRRTGIYFAMITVAIAEVFYFVEFNPLSAFTGGENGLPGVPTPSLYLGFTTIHFNTDWSLYAFLAFWYFIGIVIALRIVRSPVGVILSAIRDNPLRAAAVGHNIHGYKLTAFVIAAAYAGFAGGLLGVMQGFMPPEAFTFDTSGQLVMQTAIGGAGTLFGPLVGAAVWFYLCDFLQMTLHLGATLEAGAGHRLRAAGLLPAPRHRRRRWSILRSWMTAAERPRARRPIRCGWPASTRQRHGSDGPAPQRRRRRPCRRRPGRAHAEPILKAEGLTKRYGGVVANAGIDFVVRRGELRGIIGPNGAGKSTFFKMLTCEVPPTSGRSCSRAATSPASSVTDVCQLGLTKSYQVNQLFTRLTVRENITIAALAEMRGEFRLDLLRSLSGCRGPRERVDDTLALVHLTERAELPVSELAYGEKRRLEIGLALATSPSLLLLDEPLAGMSPSERVETVQLLKSIRHGRTMIIIDHDMDSMFELAERITVLQEGRVLAEGTPDEIKAQRHGAGSLSRRCGGGMSLLEVKGLNSYYGDSHILFDVSLRVEAHEVVALLGRNGAGKSTTLKSLMGVVTPRSGSIRVDGRDIAGQTSARHRARRHAAGAGGPPHLRQPRRRGKPDPGRPDRPGLAAGAHLRNVPAAGGTARAAAAPICPAASSRCWRSRARWCAIPRSSCSTSRSRGWRRSSCATWWRRAANWRRPARRSCWWSRISPRRWRWRSASTSSTTAILCTKPPPRDEGAARAPATLPRRVALRNPLRCAAPPRRRMTIAQDTAQWLPAAGETEWQQ